MHPEMPCIIFLPCSERIQKTSKALVLNQTVPITSDWLNADTMYLNGVGTGKV